MTDDRRGLAVTPLDERAADAGAMPIVPRGLDEDPAGMGLAGLRDGAASFRLSGGVLARHEAEIGHEFAGALEPLEVHDLRQEDHGRERVEAAEAAEPADRLPVGGRLGQARDGLVQFGLVGPGLLEREEGGVQGALRGGVLELLPAEPGPMPLRPVSCR
jgi:hypothetical protein